MKNTFTQKLTLGIFALLILSSAYAQNWARVTALPKLDVFGLAAFGDTLYAGMLNNIYTSADNGVSWQSSVVLNNAGGVTCFARYHDKVYAGSYGGGVYSTADHGTTWTLENNGLAWPYINKLLVWNDGLYAATDGEGFFVFNQVARQWSSFNNNFYVNVAGNVTDLQPYGQTMVASAGSNGTFFTFNTAAHQWQEGYYLDGILKPGMDVSALLSEGNTVFAGVLGARKQALLRSDDGGGHWYTDSVGLGPYFTSRVALAGVDVLKAGQTNNYAVVNAFYGTTGSNTASIFSRAKGAATGNRWNQLANFTQNSNIYALAETSNALFAALNSGLYFKALAALPIGMLNVTARQQEGGFVWLRWQTAQEINCSHFTIQRSSDGVTFTALGNKKAQGNSNALIDYCYVDSVPATLPKGQAVYYRIVAVDANGSKHYSNVAQVRTAMQGCIYKVWPNPFKNSLTIQADRHIQHALMQITDMAGKSVYQAAMAFAVMETKQINLAQLRAGMYILTIQGDNIHETFKLVKQP